MKTANTYEEASRMATTVAGCHIDYCGPYQEEVARKFEERYGVVPIQSGDYLIIPCTQEIEQDFCISEERFEEICSEMEVDSSGFEF